MADVKWTREQWEAISTRHCNLLVAAAAGSGKTAVLVERIIQMITDEKEPVDIDRLLVVTFTNAAATEMRERIAEAISQRIEVNPASHVLQKQMVLLGKANIMTLHSFCLEVIREHFQNIEIDPDFRIADTTESLLMKQEALSEMFETQYDDDDAAFLDLLECYGGNRDDRRLQELVLNVYEFIQSSPWPESRLGKMVEQMNIPDDIGFEKTSWGSVLVDSVRLELEGMEKMLCHAMDMLKPLAGTEKYQAVFQEDISHIQGLIRHAERLSDAKEDLKGKPASVCAGGWDQLYGALREIQFSTLPRCGKDVCRERLEIPKEIRNQVKSAIKKIREKIVSESSDEMTKTLRQLYPGMKTLGGLVNRFTEKYGHKKEQRSVLDFNDLEHHCLRILTKQSESGELTPSESALYYRERFEEILVDEYQDSNLVQEMILTVISREAAGSPNTFMVGDVKQSIYRFRQARPEIFLEKYNTYAIEEDKLFRKILLYKNFRSRTNIIHSVNYIFNQIMSVNVGELDYNETEALNPGAVFPEYNREDAYIGGETELHIMETGEAERSQEEVDSNEDEAQEQRDAVEEEIRDSVQCEARLVARRILEMMRPDEKGRYFCVFDKTQKQYRRIEYRDIAILMRSTKNQADVFAEELYHMGIPAFADTGTGFFKTVEVQVMLSLLQIIDNPLQDIALLSVLRSPVTGFTTNELADLRLKDKKTLLYPALTKLAEDKQEEGSLKAAEFLKRLGKWRAMSRYLSTDQLLWHLYEDTGYYAMVGAMPAGEQRQANLRILFERARLFEQTSYKGLFNFINFIEKLRSGKGDMGSAKALGENDNVVRIMSIHKSKGLEFPVVILSGCGKRFNMQDMNKGILIHQELGLGPDIVDHKLRISWASAAKQAIREKIKKETISEEMRILYVAMTRAREKLIITGALGDLQKALVKWSMRAGCTAPKLPDYEMIRCMSYLDWIGAALLRHPDCSNLRESMRGEETFYGPLIDDTSRWTARIWNKADIQTEHITEVMEEQSFLNWLDNLEEAESEPGLAEEVSERLNWRYHYSEASRVPAKVSVTEMKRRFEDKEQEDGAAFPIALKKPLFLEAKQGLSPAEKGTALHFVMQHLKYDHEDIEGQIDRMVTDDLLTEQQAKSINPEKIRCFLRSDLGVRMTASNRMYREVPFNIEIPCYELYGDMNTAPYEKETILLQGVIDCYFEEGKDIVLVDYKTDYVPLHREDIVLDRYRLQIDYYSRAIEMLSGKKVKERYIYLFQRDKAMQL